MAQQRMGQIQWGDLTFGPGSRYHVTAVNGLDDLPEIRAEDLNRPDQHGDYTGPDTTGARVIQLGLGLRADSPDELRDLTLALRAATQPQRQPEPLQFLDQGMLVYGKVRQRSIPYDAEYLWSTGTAALELYCADPYLYSLEEHTAATTAYSPAAGRTYPLVYALGPVIARNAVTNPSAEIGLTGITLYSGGTFDRLTTDAQYGTSSVRVTTTSGTFSGIQYACATQPAGTVVTVSAWVKAPGSGTTVFFALRNGTSTLGTGSAGTPLPNQWTRMSAQMTVPVGQTCNAVAVAYNSAPGVIWLADAVMAEAGVSGPSDYVDGDQPGCGWEGVAHASASRRFGPGATGRSYGDAGASGRLTATNDGASPAYPVLRIDGPVANPSIEQVTTGGSMTLDGTLQAGEYLVIDTRTRAVLLMGSSPRRQWVRAGSTWPLLVPGSNTLAYRGSALPGAPGQSSLLTVTWRDTSL
ncbi:phage tail domain-containing protein [Streptomyces sp. NPDC048332]|uniref:phage distal tail protein n=1 Tax=Streptomyces sp. NPDC048332 TaxID=3154619 RepID=UPI00341C7DD0